MSEHTEHCVRYDEDDDSYMVECPSCGTEQEQAVALMGSLGSIEHYRCRYCGCQWSSIAE